MQGYIIRRILLIIPTIILVCIITFLLVRWVPGSAVDVIENTLIETTGSANVDRAAIEHELGLDVPIHIQFARWFGNLLQGDLGRSIIQKRPVYTMISERVPVTIELGVLGVLLSIIIGIPLGIFSAVRQDSAGDYSFRTISILLIAVPQFWIATLVLIYPAIWWGWAPSMKLIPFGEDPLGNLGMFIIPSLILGTSTSGGLMRMVRTMMLEVMRMDYIKTAWSKGLTEKTVIIRHALKNAFIPVITIIGNQVAFMLGGSVIIEKIFNLPGMGQLVLQALNQRDYPLVSGLTLLFSFFVMFINLVVDLCYSWLDPRIRYS